MRIRWNEIEPQFAARVRARLAAVRADNPDAPERLSAAWLIFCGVVSSLFLLLYVSICFRLTGAAGMIGLTLLPVGLMGVAVVPPYLARLPIRSFARMQQSVAPDIFADALHGAAENPTEKLYADILFSLHGDRATISERQSLLRQCAHLVAKNHRLDTFMQSTANLSLPLPHQSLLRQKTAIHDALETVNRVLAERHSALLLLEESVLDAELEQLMATLRPIAARIQAIEETVAHLRR